MTDVPVLVVHVVPGTNPSHIADIVCPAAALPGRDGAHWVIVDPVPGAAEVLRSVYGCDCVQSAWAVAVLLGVPEVAPILARLRSIARTTVDVDDPDFGAVAYVLYDTPAAARAALCC